MTSVARRRAWLVAGLLAAAGIACLLFGLFPQASLGRLLEQRLRASVGPGARIGRIHVVPGRRYVELEELHLETEGYSLDIPRASAIVSAATLLGRGITLEALEIHAPRLVLRSAPTASKGSRTPPKPEPSVAAPAVLPSKPVAVRGIRLTDGALVYQEGSTPAMVSLDDIDATGSIGDGVLEIRVAGGSLGHSNPVSLGPTLATLKISTRLDVDLQSCEIGTRLSRLTARGPLGRPGTWHPEVKLAGRLDLEDLARVSRTPMSGVVAMDGRIGGSPEAFEGRALLNGRGLSVAGWPVDASTLELSVASSKEPRVVASLVIEALAGRFNGHARLVGSAIDGSLDVEGMSLDRLCRRLQAGCEAASGRIDGRLTVAGDVDRLNARAHIEARGKLRDQPFVGSADVSGPVRVEDRTVQLAWMASFASSGGDRSGGDPTSTVPRLRSFALTARGNAAGPFPPVVRGSVSGEVGFARGSVAAEATIGGELQWNAGLASISLEARGHEAFLTVSTVMRGSAFKSLHVVAEAHSLAMLASDLDGELRLDLQAAGSIERLNGTGKLTGTGLIWRGVEIGPLGADLTSRSGVGELRIALPSLNATGQAEVQRRPRPRLRGTVSLAGLPLSPFRPLVPPERALDGHVTGDVEIDVPLDRPEAAEIRAHVRELEVNSEPYSVRAARAFDLSVRGRRAEIRELRVEGHGATLDLDGSFGLDAGGVLDLDAKLDADLSRAAMPAGWTASGQALVQVHLDGPPRSPTAEGFIVADQVAMAGPRLPPLRVTRGRVDLAAGEAVAAFDAELAEGTVSLSGRGPIAPLLRKIASKDGSPGVEGKATAKISWSGVELGSILASVWPERAGLVGATLAGEAELHGDLASLAGLEGTVTMPGTPISIQDLSLQVAPVKVEIRNGTASTEEIAVSTPDGTLRVSGAVDLSRKLLDLSGRGDLRLRALSPLLAEASLTGAAYLDLSVTGSLAAPRPRGTVDVHDAALRVRDISEALTGIDGRLVFDEATVRIQEASAALGGGSVSLSGSAALAGTAVSDVKVEIRGRDIALRYPQGLRSRVTADLRLTGRTGALMLSGTVGLERGLYDLDLALQESLRAPLAPPAASPLLASIGLEIRADVVSPVQVRNNLVEIGVTGNVTIRGDAETPAPFGRLEIEPGGKLFVQGRDFHIDEGRLVYAGSWDPTLSLRARAEVRAADYTRYEVIVTAEGPINPPRPSFSSVPSLTEREIVSLLLTGQTSSLGLGGTAEVAGEQAAVLLAGRLSRSLSKGLQGFGIDEVRIQPELVARETDPSARFTFGKRLTQRLTLVYSLSLKDPENRFVQLEERPFRDVTLLGQRLDDGSFTYGAGQRIELGGAGREPEVTEEPKTRLRGARVETDAQLPKPLRPPVGAGNKLTVFDLQEEADRLREELRAEGYIEAEASARLEDDVAVFRVRPGPRFAWRVEGMADPPALSREIHEALFEGEALENGRSRLLRELRARGYLRAAVKARVEAGGTDGERALVFSVEPGPPLKAVDVRFPGAVLFSDSQLLELAGGAGELLVSPDEATQALRGAYGERHYLAAEVDPPQVNEGAGRVSIVVPIREGPAARVGGVRFEGASLPVAELTPLVGLQIGAPYDENAVLEAVVRLRDRYLTLGYPAVRVKPELEPVGNDLTVVLRVVEGERVLAGPTEISGAQRTRHSLILKQVPLKPGEPVDPRLLATGERRLLELGVFSRVAISTSAQEPGTLHVELRELAPFAVGYQFRYNDDKGASGDLEGQVRNLFGRALALGARYERGRDAQEFRGSFVMPSLFGRGSITLSAFRNKEQPALGPDVPPDTPRDTILERGAAFVQALHLPNRWDALLGYRFMRSTITSSFFLEPISENIAALETSLLRETRDNPLNARRGRFWSVSLEYSPKSLGSSFTFIKGLAQFFTFHSFGESLSWGQGYRLGLAHGFGGQDLVSTERFNAGGGNSVRGFATDSLGPVDFLGDPAGGDAVLIFNQELRYLHRSGFGAALFYDAGNVFALPSDLSFDLRHSVGTGVRWDSPIGLLRLDLGFPLARREGEKAYRLFFSLGQAF